MKESRVIAVNILGKEYKVSCPEGKEHELLDAAYYLNEEMKKIKSQGRVIGLERIAIMSCLNLAHDLLRQRNQKQDYIEGMNCKLEELQSKIVHVLEKDKLAHALGSELI